MNSTLPTGGDRRAAAGGTDGPSSKVIVNHHSPVDKPPEAPTGKSCSNQAERTAEWRFLGSQPSRKPEKQLDLLDEIIEERILDYLAQHPEGLTLDRAGWKLLSDGGWARVEVRRALTRLFRHEMIYTMSDQGSLSETILVEQGALDEFLERGCWPR